MLESCSRMKLHKTGRFSRGVGFFTHFDLIHVDTGSSNVRARGMSC